jgi:DNA-binding MarR family transcriptional regulator
LLDHLEGGRGVTLCKLAEHIGVNRSAMGIMVDCPVRGGYVARRRERNDGRYVGLTLAARVLLVKDENSVLDPRLVREILGLMPAGEPEAGIGGVERLATHARILLSKDCGCAGGMAAASGGFLSPHLGARPRIPFEQC